MPIQIREIHFAEVFFPNGECYRRFTYGIGEVTKIRVAGACLIIRVGEFEELVFRGFPFHTVSDLKTIV